jgi:hypothetical protein
VNWLAGKLPTDASLVSRRGYLILFALGSLAVVPFFSLYQTASINDEGIVCLGAYRLWLGQAIYTDFTTHFAPGTYFLTLLAYGLFGPSMWATRLVMALVAGGLALSVYALSVRCLSPRWALAPYFLFVCAGVTQWPILSYHWMGVLSFLLGTLALLRWTENPCPSTALMCGATTALTGWILQSEVAALLLLTCLVAAGWRAKMTARLIGFWMVGMLVTSLLLWAPILARTSVAEIYLQNVDWAINHNAEPGRAPYSLSHIGDRWKGFLRAFSQAKPSVEVAGWVVHSVSYLLVWSFNYVMFYPIFLLAAGYALKKTSAESFRLLVLAQLVSMLAWQSRQTLLYLNFLTPIYFILAIWLFRRWRRAGAIVAGLVCLVYAVGYGYQVKEAAGFRYPISTPRGVLYASGPDEAAIVQKTFQQAMKWTPPGTPAYCYPYAMGFFFLSGVTPVGRLPLVIPILGPDDEVPRLAQQLHQDQVEFIYKFTWSEDTLHAVPFVDQKRFWALVNEFDALILRGYEPVAELGNGKLYRRQPEP